MTSQYIECCLCGHKFKVSSAQKDIEQCPKCRGRRLLRRTDIAMALKKGLEQHSKIKQKTL